MRTKDSDLQRAGLLIRSRGANELNAGFADLRVGLLHGDAAIFDLAVMHVAEKERSDVLAIGIEYHVAGNAFIVFDTSQGVANPAAIQSGTANCIYQNLHLIVSKGGELIGIIVEARFVTPDKFLPSRIVASGIVGKESLETFRCRASDFDEFI